MNLQHLCSSEKSILYTGIFDKKTVVVKTINPLCQDDIFVEDLETELSILSKVKHNNIIQLYGAGRTPNGNRFLILEYLEGGTLSQKVQLKTVNKYSMCKRNQFKFKMEDVLIHARSIADALEYCQTSAIDDCMVLHRDLKPDNIGMLIYQLLSCYLLFTNLILLQRFYIKWRNQNNGLWVSHSH